MRKTALGSKRAGASSERDLLPVLAVSRWAESWFADCQISERSPNTIALRKIIVEKLVWFLTQGGYSECCTESLRDFLTYLKKPHPEGRWGNKQITGSPRPKTVRLYYDDLSAFFRYLVRQNILTKSPIAPIPRPKWQPDQLQPFSDDQVRALLEAARHSDHPLRDEAFLLFLLDTGARVEEAVNLHVRDIDLKGRFCLVNGKGAKVRRIYFGAVAHQAILRYMNDAEMDDDDPLWPSERGRTAGAALTRNGAHQLLARLGRKAKLVGVRCSPHTCRHTFAINFLRRRPDPFALKEILGHTDLKQTQNYLKLAQAGQELALRRGDARFDGLQLGLDDEEQRPPPLPAGLLPGGLRLLCQAAPCRALPHLAEPSRAM